VRTLKDREGEEGYRIKFRAEELARVCKHADRGDMKAAEAIIAAAMTA
jgi:hypothetical protein